MNVIWKYMLSPGASELRMPADAQVLTVQTQNGVPQLWAKLNPAKPATPRVFVMYGTGQPMPDDPTLVHVATFQLADGGLVLHVFEVPTTPREETTR